MVRWPPLSSDLPEHVRDFKRALRSAIHNAGFRTLKQLSDQTKIPISTLSDAASSSLKVPEWANLERLLRACRSQAPADTRYSNWTVLYRLAHDTARATKSSPDNQVQARSPNAAPAPDQTGPVDNHSPQTLWDVVGQDGPQHATLVTVVAHAVEALEQPNGGHADRLITILDRLLAPWLADVAPVEAALLLLAAHHHTLGDRLAAYLHQLPPTQVTWRGIPLANQVIALCRSVDLPTVQLRGQAFDAVPGLDVDLRFCAVAFRIAELFEVTDGRPPAVVRGHVGLPAFPWATSGGINTDGLTFPQDRPSGYAVSLLARPDHPSAEHDLRHYLAAVDSELLQCQALRLEPHPRRGEVTLPGHVAIDRIFPTGYKYGEFRFELDREAILELFMGEQLYDDPHVFVRELLQNAFDASRLRRHLHGDEPHQRVAVTCWQDETWYLWVRVDDPGVGMDEHALRAYFLRVGRSYYRSPEFAAELVQRGKERASFTPISRFGIGVLACFMVADRVEVSTRRLYADGTLATPLRLSLSRDVDYFVLREEGMPAGPMPARTPAEAAAYRQNCGTSIAVRVDPLRAQVTQDGVAKAVDRYLFCPPIPVTLNGYEVWRITDDLVDRPWVDGIHVVEVPIADRLPTPDSQRTPISERLPYWGPLRIAVIPMDLTRHSATPMLRGQMIGVQVLDDQKVSDLLIGLSIASGDPQLAAARKLLRTAVVKLEISAQWDWRRGQRHKNLSIFVERTLDKNTIKRAIKLLQPGSIERSESPRTLDKITSYGKAQVVLNRRILLDALTNAMTAGNSKSECLSSTRFMVDWTLLRDPHSPMTLPEGPWLGHNGIAIPQALTERARRHTIRDGCVLQTGKLTVCGVVALRDALRPDVSVARNQLRYVPFGVHSALHLAVRRAVAPLWGGPFEDFAKGIINQNLIDIPPPGYFTIAAVADPLIDGGAWDEEPLANFSQSLSIAEMRRRFLKGERVERYFDPVGNWADDNPDADANPFDFSHVICNTLLHTRLELALRPQIPYGQDWDGEGEWEDDEDENVVVVGIDPPKRSLGEKAFPPLIFLPFLDGSTRIRSREGGWNLHHPAIVWIVDHAEELVAHLPAAYDRLRAALAPPKLWETGVHPDPEGTLAGALALIARLRPDLAPPDISGSAALAMTHLDSSDGGG